jgi:hypothetical protein
MSGAPSDCPVCPSTAKKPMTRKWLEAINTPNHLSQWYTSFLKFTFNTRAIAFTPRHISKIKSPPSLKINSIA